MSKVSVDHFLMTRAERTWHSAEARLRRYMRDRGHLQFNMKMARDACAWMADFSSFYDPRRDVTEDDGQVDILKASDQLVSGVRRFAALVVEAQEKHQAALTTDKISRKVRTTALGSKVGAGSYEIRLPKQRIRRVSKKKEG